MPGSFLLYGSNGYTGRLIADHAVARGLRPILAGRNAAEVSAQATSLGLEHRIFPLDAPDRLGASLSDVPLVLHCAGPFSRTSGSVSDGCLRQGRHYLDITGEIEVFESLAKRDAEAKAAGVMLLPGVGFDVVPSDCLAAHLVRRLPSATRLALGFQVKSRPSRGTATTMIENIRRGGAVRRDGSIISVPWAWKTRMIDFGNGPVTATTIPWGDVATAHYSTGIGNIEVYVAVPPSAVRLMKASRHMGWLLGSSLVQSALKKMVRRGPPGPSSTERAKGVSLVWGEVEDKSGNRAVSRLRGPETYAFSALTAVAAVERVLGGNFAPGFQTPSRAFGADFVLEIEGVVRKDD